MPLETQPRCRPIGPAGRGDQNFSRSTPASPCLVVFLSYDLCAAVFAEKAHSVRLAVNRFLDRTRLQLDQVFRQLTLAFFCKTNYKQLDKARPGRYSTGHKMTLSYDAIPSVSDRSTELPCTAQRRMEEGEGQSVKAKSGTGSNRARLPAAGVCAPIHLSFSPPVFCMIID